MARPPALDPAAVDAALGELPGWELRDGKLHRELRFADFATAFGFMAAAATVAAEMDHHPEWSNVYSRVTVDLVTHDAGGVTELDLGLARRMSELAAHTATG
jgi:4a-hydroxytetrahydrobiopterin dehydratase